MFDLSRETVVAAAGLPNQQSWPIHITALVSGTATPANVFVYQTAAAPIADMDFFSCVAGAPQMTELPVGSGAPGVPFYRVSTVLVHCRSADHAEEFWYKIKTAVQDLADNLSLVSLLSESESVTITPHA